MVIYFLKSNAEKTVREETSPIKINIDSQLLVILPMEDVPT